MESRDSTMTAAPPLSSTKERWADSTPDSDDISPYVMAEPSYECTGSLEIRDQMSVLLDALQEEASTASPPSMEPATPSEPCSQPLAIEEVLLGSWVDSQGNAIVVYHSGLATDLSASFTKEGKQDIHFGLWQELGEGAWHCGDATLDTNSCSTDYVTWKFSNGNISTWSRQQWIERQWIESQWTDGQWNNGQWNTEAYDWNTQFYMEPSQWNNGAAPQIMMPSTESEAPQEAGHYEVFVPILVLPAGWRDTRRH